MLHVGASGCVHIVAVDMSGPAKISAEGKNCAEVLRSLSERDTTCTQAYNAISCGQTLVAMKC